jgi:hypothetical protein
MRRLTARQQAGWRTSATENSNGARRQFRKRLRRAARAADRRDLRAQPEAIDPVLRRAWLHDLSGFVELGWDESRLYLEQIPAQPDPPKTLVANIRILVPDIDRFWSKCGEMNLTVVKEIADRDYGLRDFTVVSPDGIGLRFASRLPGR